MANLHVRDFSCISQADIELSKFTVLIGPQASGKSIISKLTYFFYSIAPMQAVIGADIRTDIEEFAEEISKKFRRWFPPSAWGDGRFYLVFEAGDFYVEIYRKKPYRKPSGDFDISFSKRYAAHFKAIADRAKSLGAAAGKRTGDEFLEVNLLYSVMQMARSRLSDLMGADYVTNQMFVPAGRSFFTSVNRAISVFEQADLLDPLTLEFGRYWARHRDRRLPFQIMGRGSAHALVAEIFGGQLVRSGDAEYVKSVDGRLVPLTALSSGQQELLPLWEALQTSFSDPTRRTLMYIEEPEAHLFPEAQSKLVQHLASLVSGSNDGRKLFITTHSPYVLTKLNNLLKAGSLGFRSSRDRQDKISKVIPSKSWLQPRQLRAYAIIDRQVQLILGGDGLIDGEYLDKASVHLGREFDELLEIEYTTTKRGTPRK